MFITKLFPNEHKITLRNINNIKFIHVFFVYLKQFKLLNKFYKYRQRLNTRRLETTGFAKELLLFLFPQTDINQIRRHSKKWCMICAHI